VTVVALLATLVLIFAFQAENITRNGSRSCCWRCPSSVQVYFNSRPHLCADAAVPGAAQRGLARAR
jgi:ACR3 family arsenite efflux pump ArsB